MRCKACDCELSDSESIKKDSNTEEYLDMCFGCLYQEILDYDYIESLHQIVQYEAPD